MAWLKILVFSLIVLFSVTGIELIVELLAMAMSLILTLIVGLVVLGSLGWFLALDGSLTKFWQFVRSRKDNWLHLFFEREVQIFDERSAEFKALSHEQKIKVLQKKYASDPIKFESKVRIRWIVVSGIVSLLVLIALWQFGQANKVDTKVFSAAIALLVGAPVALMVWYFRDQNNVRELERQHHDVTLKEFQKLQEWATGNIADGYNEDGSQKKHAETLQISALQQLRPFLKGEFGESFKRGVFEIYISVLKTEHQNILKLFQEQKVPLSNEEVQKVINGIPLAKQINQIASEEWFCLLVNHDFPTAGISLVGVNLSECYLRNCKNKSLNFNDSDLTGVNLEKSILLDASLSGATLDYANLYSVNLQGANIRNATLQKSNLAHAFLPGATLRKAILNGANLKDSWLQCADLLGAQFFGANLMRARLFAVDLRFACLQGACLSDAKLQGANMLSAELQGAMLNGAELQGVYLARAKIQGVQFFSARLQGTQSREKYESLEDLVGVESDLSFPCIKNPMRLEQVSKLKEELLKFCEFSLVDEIIHRIQQDGSLSPPFCDLSNAELGSFSYDEFLEWQTEFARFIEYNEYEHV